MSQLEDLLQQCTVKITVPDRLGWGTGFFVAPEWILTCAHVVQEAKGQPVQVRWQKQDFEAVVERSLPDPYDLALLRVTQPIATNPPCVYLDAEIRSRDPLYLFGYPDQDFPNGCPVTFNCEGLTGDEPALIKFALGQVRPGMSGSPLLNQRTGKVCGIVKFTRDRSFDLGGGAIPTRVILEQFPELVELQKAFHGGDRRWSDLVAKSSDVVKDPQSLPTSASSASMNQTNVGGINYQTQIGDNSTAFIGGVHHHYGQQGGVLSQEPSLPSGSADRKVVRSVLMSAFPEEGDLAMMLLDEMNVRLNQVAGGKTYKEIVFNLVIWAESQGLIEPLIRAGHRANPGNPDLLKLIKALGE